MILVTYGTRPELIKLRPLVEEMSRRGIAHKLFSTGQHEDLANAEDLDVIFISKEHWERCSLNDNRLDNIFSSCLGLYEEIFEDVKSVMVQGDTSSAAALAIAAHHRKIPVMHLEAGLRTYDVENPYPEEVNRKIISSIATTHFCPTSDNVANLQHEKANGHIYKVGNTAIDNLLPYKDQCEYQNKVLVTLHRRENHSWMPLWFEAIDDLASQYDAEFLLPLHPNPEVSKHKGILQHVKVIDPMSHDELLKYLLKTKVVITDSGGIQEECSFFNKRCLVCRRITERPEAVNMSSSMVPAPMSLGRKFKAAWDSYDFMERCPYGDGNSASIICNYLESMR